MRHVLVTFCVLVLAGVGAAVAGESHDAASEPRIVEMWSCTLKDGKTPDEVRATNSRWLKAVNEKLEGSPVASYVLENIVGAPNSFGYLDVYPSLEVWAAAKRAGQSDVFEAIDAEFDELSDCSSNSLHRSHQS
ncbi:MAG: hypothetical protein DWQ36_25820 [Acidobacteria bacterium]|nr:MAG: hypothetical protein DWQ30_17645 [Acidobacteriota bacterium]REJ99431.1 MAG: hypothetical protein DWQ36_25820 [Acidobacteriota bacterium]